MIIVSDPRAALYKAVPGAFVCAVPRTPPCLCAGGSGRRNGASRHLCFDSGTVVLFVFYVYTKEMEYPAAVFVQFRICC